MAYHGLFPRFDWNGDPMSGRYAKAGGKPLAGGPYALVEVRGDWKWHKEAFSLKTWWRSKDGICFHCRAANHGVFKPIGLHWQVPLLIIPVCGLCSYRVSLR